MRILRTIGFAVLLVGALAGSLASAQEVKIPYKGLTLNARLQLADGKALADGAVLLVHGTLAHNGMDTIKNLADVLNERGMNTLAINLSLGLDDRQGMYDCAVTHRHKHLDALDEIALWFEWLKDRGAGDVVLLGHSRGGNQVTRFAAERGAPAMKRLVLLAPATWTAKRAAAGFERTQGRPLKAALAKAEGLVATGKGAAVMAKVGLLYCPGADATAESFVSYYRPDPRFDTPSILAEVNVPTLVVAGGKDTVVEGLPERVGPMADGERLHLSVIDDADHFFLDLYAEDVADAVEEFLSPSG